MEGNNGRQNDSPVYGPSLPTENSYAIANRIVSELLSSITSDTSPSAIGHLSLQSLDIASYKSSNMVSRYHSSKVG